MTAAPHADRPDGVPFVKGHGTENDFVLLPDLDGALGPPSAALVRGLCDRRAGLGADGVIRVVPSALAQDPVAASLAGEAEWFMDYRNADGSVSEMCGNGVRVMAELLRVRELVDLAQPLPLATRDGVKTLTWDRDLGQFTADMGVPDVRGETWVAVDAHRRPARHVQTGNPHAVTFVDDLAEAGSLLAPPAYDEEEYPEGVNVEFVVRRGEGHVAMRVHERGSGETRSCGTGACAVMVAAATADGSGPGSSYVVDVPGGRLRVRWTEAGRLELTGPAVLVAEGYWFAPV